IFYSMPRYEFGLAGIPIFIYSVGTIFLTESDVYKKKNADNISKQKRQLIVGLCLPFLDQFSGVNIIVFYTPIILQMAKLKTRIQSLSVNLGLAGWDTLFTLPPLTMIERAGRRTCLIIGQSMTSIGMLLIAIGYLVPALVEKDIQYVLCIPGLVLFVAGYEFGSGGVFYVLMAEMFPSFVAGVMSSLIMLLLQICAVIIVTGFEPLTKAVSEGAVFTFLTVKRRVNNYGM
ncbi:MAG: hypothetical protein EZS28_015884, partial [Streblomastix strix]